MPKIGFDDAFKADFSGKVQQLTKDLDGLVKQFKVLGTEAREVNKAISSSKTFKELSANAKKASDATTKFANSEKKLIKGIQAVRFEATQEAKQLAILNEQKRRARKANTEFARSQLTAAKSTNTFGKAIKSFLFKANFLANVMANLAQTIGRAFARALRSAFETIKDFDGAVANLAAITGKTREEISELTKQAKELGGVTKFTATQVTSLQIELAKLGFSANEISNATAGILDFAAATGADLAAAAKVAGVAVKAFGLSTTETEDAVATLAVATTKSALAFEDYETILSTLGPVAKAFGFSLEDSIALTGKLRDAGLDASKAATATRNILLNLADANGALAKSLGGPVKNFDELIDGLIQLDKEGVSLATTLELTDKRSVAAFNQFLTGAESARVLKGEISDVNDQLEEMVKTQLDSLPGDVDLLKSAWQGLIQTLSDGGAFRSVIQFLTDAILQISNLTSVFRRFHKLNDEQIKKTFDFLSALSNKQGREFQAVIEGFSDATVATLIENRREIIKQLAEVRNVNEKEAAALFSEFIRRRRDEIDIEVNAETDKFARIEKQRKDAAKKEAADLKAQQQIDQLAIDKELKAKEAERTEKIQEARDKLNAAYALSKQLIAQIEAPKDLEELLQIDADKADNLAKIIEGSLEDIDLGEDFFNSFLDGFEDTGDGAIEAAQTLSDKLFEIGEAQRNRTKAANDKAAQERTATEKSIINSIEGLGTEGFNIFSNLQQRKIESAERSNQEEIDLLDNRLKKGLISQEVHDQKRVSAEERLNNEINILRKKQDVLQKAQAIFSIGINTAVAAMNVAGQTGVGAAIAVPLVIALGAAQVAAVLSEPVPQYEKGTKSSIAGRAIVGEKGLELMIEPSGKVGLSPAKASMMDLKKGTEIVPADITNELLKYAYIANGFEGKANDNTIHLMMNELKGLRRDMKVKPVASSTLTPGGILTSIHKGNTTILKNKRFCP